MRRLLASASLGLIGMLAACGDESGTEEGTASSTTSEISATTSASTTALTVPRTAAPQQTTAVAPPARADVTGAGGITVPNMVGEDLQLAQDTMQAAGLYLLKSHDVTGQDRSQVLDRNWKVCDQSPPGGTQVSAETFIDFGVVKDEERCP